MRILAVFVFLFTLSGTNVFSIENSAVQESKVKTDIDSQLQSSQEKDLDDGTFIDYCSKYNKKYTDEEFEQRKAIFYRKKSVLETVSLKGHGVNYLSDFTEKELQALNKGSIVSGTRTNVGSHSQNQTLRKSNRRRLQEKEKINTEQQNDSQANHINSETQLVDGQIHGEKGGNVKPLISQSEQKKNPVNPIQSLVSESSDQLKTQSNQQSQQQDNIPASFDWRDYGAVTDVKVQGQCGACWAFSTVAFFESDLIINRDYDSSIDLSEQYLITCNNRSLGCDGGYLMESIDFVLEKGGLPLETEMPYKQRKASEEYDYCSTSELQQIQPGRVRISYYEVESVDLIKQLILKQPLNIYICSASLQNYSPGPNKHDRTLECNPKHKKKNHNVLLVGYTESEWIIKNQWGPDWGIDGYGYISQKSRHDCCIDYQLHITGEIVPQSQCQIYKCELCADQVTCLRCETGYFIGVIESQPYIGEHLCVPCSEDHCVECYDYYGKCRECIEGYSVYFPGSQCSPSKVQHCVFAQQEYCYECSKGYVLVGQDTCISLEEWQKQQSQDDSSGDKQSQNDSENESNSGEKSPQKFAEDSIILMYWVAVLLGIVVALLLLLFFYKRSRRIKFTLNEEKNPDTNSNSKQSEQNNQGFNSQSQIAQVQPETNETLQKAENQRSL